MAVSFSAVLSLVVLAVLLCSGTGQAGDRGEFGKVLQAMPPNGPFWKYGNVIMRRKSVKAGMAPVVFPHWSHRAQYTCRVCHLELEFSMRSGDTGVTRAQYLAGKYCGACHDGKTAFSVRDGDSSQCGKCHMKDTRALGERFEKFAEKLPLSSFGNGIDWAEALRNGQIAPANSIRSKLFTMQFPEKLKAPIKLGTSSPRSDVAFSHEDHFAELDCSSCHPDIFNIKKKGTEAFTMERNIYGNFCGVCHMLVAFPMNDCRRCHAQMGSSSGY
ncbi:MAG TPA: c(7)-type cytochrome triheme domain-containing protein [Desulfuromonadaceae bacterium]